MLKYKTQYLNNDEMNVNPKCPTIYQVTDGWVDKKIH